jgi:hypothetical protein
MSWSFSVSAYTGDAVTVSQMVYVITTVSETDCAQVNESEPPLTVPTTSRSVVFGQQQPFGNDIQTGEPVLPFAGQRQPTPHRPLPHEWRGHAQRNWHESTREPKWNTNRR